MKNIVSKIDLQKDWQSSFATVLTKDYPYAPFETFKFFLATEFYEDKKIENLTINQKSEKLLLAWS
jgi:hypothetical protein